MAAPFDWNGFLELAGELSERSGEAALRTALSRAYYFVYHLALERARSNDYSARPGEGNHQQLWRHYSTSPEPACQQLAQIGTRMKVLRERADYEKQFARLAEEVPPSLEDAREFAKRLNQLPARHPRVSPGSR